MPIVESEKVVRTADVKARTKEFAGRVMKFIDALLRTSQGRIITNQIIRSAATSVATNYRAACRALFLAEVIGKIGVVDEEIDQTCFWLALIIDSRLLTGPTFGPILGEAYEIVIMAASQKTEVCNRRSVIR